MAGEGDSLLIAQMTDIHIGFDPDGGEDEANLARYRQAIAHLLEWTQPPDMLFLTGDLTDRGDEESFARILEPLAEAPFTIHPLVGNHDTRAALLRTFPDCPSDNGFIHYAIEADGLRIVCLDTVEPGRHGGAFCPARADWLQHQLASHPDTPTLIFMHHPPVISGIDWMDPKPDEDWIANFARAIGGHNQILAIHTGHLHRSMHTSFRGIPLGVTGSLAPAVTPDLRAIDPARPDGRLLVADEPPVIALHRWNEGQLATHYVPVGNWPELAHYVAGIQPMIKGMIDERK